MPTASLASQQAQTEGHLQNLVNEAKQAPEQDNLPALQRMPAWVSGSSSFEPLLAVQDQLP